MELEQVVHTRGTLCRSGLPGEFGGLNPRSNSFRAFISVSVGSTPLSYLFTTATVQILGGHTAPKYGTKPLRYYVTRHFSTEPYSSFQGSTLTRHTSLAPADEWEGTLGTRLTSQNSNKQTFQIELSAWMLFYVKYNRKSQ